MELMESQPLLEWLANNYKSFGATLEIITDKSQEGSQFVRGFGGIGGELITVHPFFCVGQEIDYLRSHLQAFYVIKWIYKVYKATSHWTTKSTI